jgi:metal-responsive CopG/Arc/MetJ family transcriptional regulator
MRGGARTVHRRVNITLPEETIRLIDRTTARGDRSRFIDQAVRYFVQAARRTKLRNS